VGYVISGRAKLELEGQTLNLRAGDPWLVPAGAMHRNTIIEPFTAVEATAPPAESTVATNLRVECEKIPNSAR
jgi:quercetin dioxygenase-like cupin family protein